MRRLTTHDQMSLGCRVSFWSDMRGKEMGFDLQKQMSPSQRFGGLDWCDSGWARRGKASITRYEDLLPRESYLDQLYDYELKQKTPLLSGSSTVLYRDAYAVMAKESHAVVIHQNPQDSSLAFLLTRAEMRKQVVSLWVVELLQESLLLAPRTISLGDLNAFESDVKVSRKEAEDKVVCALCKQFLPFSHEESTVCQSGTILERFDGFVEKVEDGIAYVSLRSEHGDTLYGSYSARSLEAKGIFERRRFRCVTVKNENGVNVELEAIADKDVSRERQLEIWKELQRTLDSEDDADT